MIFGLRDGDQAWTGIDMTRDRSVVNPGYLALGQNTRMRTRRCKQRAGTSIPPDFNPPGGFQAQLNGSGVFNNPNGDDMLLISPCNQQYTWGLADGADPIKIDYSSAEVSSGRTNGDVNGIVTFSQAFDHVVLLRNPTASGGKNLAWDGTGDANRDGHADTKWTAVTTPLTMSRTLTPTTFNAEPFQDRLLFYDAYNPVVPWRDVWYASEIGDYTSYDDPFSVIETNPGESDYITRIMAYLRGSCIVFKNQSIHQVEFLGLDSLGHLSYDQRILTTNQGSIGTRVPLQVGGDVIFASEQRGFFRISEVIQENTIVLPIAVSEKIQPAIDGINWSLVPNKGCSAVLDNYALFGMPVGNTTQACNAIFVYNTQTQEWESAADTWQDPNFAFDALHVVTVNGIRQVVAVDYRNAVCYLMYDGVDDFIKSGIWGVPYKIETRGYTGGDPVAWKRFFRAKVAISTLSPLITITAITDGYAEEKILTPTPITKDPTEFYTHGTPPFNPNTDDPNQPKREDYSSILPSSINAATEDYELYPNGTITQLSGTFTTTSGPNQQSLERYITRQSGRWQSIRVENNHGSCDVLAVGVEGNFTKDTARTAA